jgi:Beta-lactamase enzyme family/ORF 12 gene product N-terminal
MTEDKTRKIAIRERMAATGEPDGVAGRAVADSRQRAAAGDPGAAEDQDTTSRGGHAAARAEDEGIGAAGLSARELAGRGRAAAAASSPPAFISTAVPDAPVGRQLAWLLGAVADLPWSGEVIEAHFDAGFLAQIGPDELNAFLAPLQPLGASLLGVLWQGPSDDPVALRAAAAFGGLRRTVTIVVDGAGLISALEFTLPAAASSPPVSGPAAVPDTPAGRQLDWFLGAAADVPLSRQVIETHFAAAFLAQIGPDDINSHLAALQTPAGGSLTELLSDADDPNALVAVAAFGDVKITVTITVDGAGLISGLLLLPDQPPPGSWDEVDRDLAALAPDASFLAARVSPDGNCTPIHQVASSTARPIGAMCALFVLGALARQIAAGRVSWDQELTVTDAVKAPGSMSLQGVLAGTRVPVRQAADKMMSVGDDTAADMLIHLVGRSAVEAQARRWSGHAALNVPFLTARELFVLKEAGYPELANQYLRLAPGQRAEFLAAAVDPVPLSQAHLHTVLPPWPEPRDIGSIGWFASPDDIGRALAGLQQLAAQPALAPLGPMLSANDGGIGLDPARWPTVGTKGGFEPGVLATGCLATDSEGQTFVVIAMFSNPAEALPMESAVPGLQAIIRAAIELVR